MIVRNPSRSAAPLVRARWCETFLCRLRGLTFRRSLQDGAGILLVYAKESRSAAAIHMWMVRFRLGVVWLDAEWRVVDRQLALPWRIYAPRAPARFVLEASPEILERVAVGDRLELEEDAAA